MTTMNDQDRAHALRVVNAASESIFEKYSAGALLHGGHLPHKGGLQAEAWAEAVDLIVYLSTIKEQLGAIHLALQDGKVQEATSALRLLLYGDTTDTLPGVVVGP
jgi:deoxyhypusine synthase